MVVSRRVPGFLPSRNGFPFANAYPAGNPVILAETPFGDIRAGDASRGLCGGMIFAAADLFLHGIRDLPSEPTPPLFRYFCRRLMASWNLPFGGLKYYEWQIRPNSSRFWGGVRIRPGVSYLTLVQEWPRMRASLDDGQLTPLGLVKVQGRNPLQLGLNHQVLAYGYELDPDQQELTITIYDPNYPGDDTCHIRVHMASPDIERPVYHSCEGPNIRGFFFTEYRRPASLPDQLLTH